jgi:hypothetical protein
MCTFSADYDRKMVHLTEWMPSFGAFLSCSTKQVLAERAGLPCLTINTIPQFTAQLVGDWRENVTAVKVLPAENGDKILQIFGLT